MLQIEFYRGFSMKNGEEEDDNSWQSILGAFIRGLVDSKQEVEDNRDEDENMIDWRRLYNLYRRISMKNGEDEDDNSWQSVIRAFLGGFFKAQTEPESNGQEDENLIDWRRFIDLYRRISMRNGEEDENLIDWRRFIDLYRRISMRNGEEDENLIDWRRFIDLYRRISLRNGEDEDDNSWQSVLGAFIRGLCSSQEEIESNKISLDDLILRSYKH